LAYEIKKLFLAVSDNHVFNVRIIRAVIDGGHVYGEQALTVTKRRAPAEAI
jgi:hypothetical protein